ncbi:nucleoside hydrolase [Chitinivorax sp. B]|uniref:nucleoside hydrolase n=1 Tax=Chitinivorax sp. B TaxID=2502235 RepID=UPI0010F69881|nr:nucleoside hydrolase [Chitinivorax sp. B]
MTRLKLVLDVDTGTDDAVAIMMAALHPRLDLVACTVVNGNAPVNYCTDNTLRVLDNIGRADVPVYRGAHKPLVRPDFPKPRDPAKPKALHGLTLPLPATSRQAEARHAAQFLVEHFAQYGEDLMLVAVGPLTNLALAVELDPSFPSHVRRLIIMGGGHEVANTTPSAEFNFWADPEAASVVFNAGFKDVTVVPLDATHTALITYQDCERLVQAGTPAALAAELFIRQRIDVHEETEKMPIPGSAPVHDALCIGALLDPELIITRQVHVDVETAGSLTVGRSVMDVHQRGDRPANARVAFSADRQRFVELMVATLSLTADEACVS